MSRAATETALSLAIRQALNADPSCHFLRVNAGGYRGRSKGAPSGTADLIGCVRMGTTISDCSFDTDPKLVEEGIIQSTMTLTFGCGRFAALEVKLPGKKPTAKQEAFMAAIRALGGFSCHVTSVGEAVSAVARCKEGGDR